MRPDSETFPTFIRRLRPAEAALVNHLALASLWNVEMAGRPLAEVNALLQRVPSLGRMLARGGSYFVAEIAGVVSGGGGWSLMPVDERPTGARQPLLSPLFFIDPEQARRGLKARLLAHIEDDIVRAGHSHAHALVPLGSASSYESLGYRPVAVRQFADTRLSAARLRKRLTTELAAVA
jgi:hypothetical protein